MLDPELDPYIKKIEDATTRDEQIDALHEYVAVFDKFLELKLEQKTNEELQNLLRIHEELMQHATAWMQEGKEEYKIFKQKAKGIRAYVDKLPSRFGRYRPIKG